MEPVTSSAMVATIVGYLAKTLNDNKSIQEFFKDFTNATVEWIRPIFLKEDGDPKDMLKTLKNKPESEPRQVAVRSALEIALEDDPSGKSFIEEMYLKIIAKDEQNNNPEIRIINMTNKEGDNNYTENR